MDYPKFIVSIRWKDPLAYKGHKGLMFWPHTYKNKIPWKVMSDSLCSVKIGNDHSGCL